MAAPGIRNFLFSKRFDRYPWYLLMQDFTPSAILSGVFIGALSYITMDGFIHPELNKPWLNLIDFGALHWYCSLAGLVGLFGVVIGWIWRSKVFK